MNDIKLLVDEDIFIYLDQGINENKSSIIINIILFLY
jgi:hypothetical protein